MKAMHAVLPPALWPPSTLEYLPLGYLAPCNTIRFHNPSNAYTIMTGKISVPFCLIGHLERKGKVIVYHQ